jgi:hypothetical protein
MVAWFKVPFRAKPAARPVGDAPIFRHAIGKATFFNLNSEMGIDELFYWPRCRFGAPASKPAFGGIEEIVRSTFILHVKPVWKPALRWFDICP